MLLFINLFKGKKLTRKKKTQKADRLGMCSSRCSKSSFSDNRSLGTSSSFVDHTSLSLFGNSNELDYVTIEYVMECITTTCCISLIFLY